MGLAIPGDIFVCHKWEDTSGIQWVEASSLQKNYPAPNVKSAEVKNPKGKATPNYQLKIAIYKVVITKKANFKEKVCFAK